VEHNACAGLFVKAYSGENEYSIVRLLESQ